MSDDRLYRCETCGQEMHARTVEQAAEAHDLFQDGHEFALASEEVAPHHLPTIDLDEHVELFRLVTDGCGDLIAVTDEGEELARVTVAAFGDGEEGFRQALVRLAAPLAEALNDPTN